MPTKKQTVSVRLDDAARLRLDRAARIANQSAGGFLETAGQERARRVLIDWALQRYRQGDTSFSELAADTGLAVEEIMQAAGTSGANAALEMFLASCRSIAEANDDPQFFE